MGRRPANNRCAKRPLYYAILSPEARSTTCLGSFTYEQPKGAVVQCTYQLVNAEQPHNLSMPNNSPRTNPCRPSITSFYNVPMLR